jgi:hypothetical protein
MRTETVVLYTFDELQSEQAKEKAREWYRGIMNDDGNDWAEFVLSDAAHAAELLGIAVSTREVKLYGGGRRFEPEFWWDLGQGGGVSFSGSYRYRKGAARDIARETPQDAELQGIARRLQSVQRTHFYGLTADIATGRGQRLDVTVYNRDGYEVDGDAADTVTECLKDFAAWIHGNLQQEWDYQYSDEAVDESLRANEYEFTAAGERW